MGFRDALKALFLLPSARPAGGIRCVTHDRVFSDPLEASFHETMNLNCRFERAER